MDNVLSVGRTKSVGDLQSQIEKRFQQQRTSGNFGLQRLAFQQLHGNEILAVPFTDVVNGAYIRTVQGGSRLGFPLEARWGLRVLGKFIGKELDGHEAVQARVLGFVDHTHPSGTKLLDDAVVRDGLADHAQECYGGSMPKSMKAMELSESRALIGCKDACGRTNGRPGDGLPDAAGSKMVKGATVDQPWFKNGFTSYLRWEISIMRWRRLSHSRIGNTDATTWIPMMSRLLLEKHEVSPVRCGEVSQLLGIVRIVSQ
jgi:hypothetical protein